MISDIPSFDGLNTTINTTEDCNLRCKYCYETNKCNKSIDVNKCYKFIDLIFSELDPVNSPISWLYDGLVIDFIGGDSLIDVKLLDKILRYLNYKYITSDKFKIRGWRCSISTNGTLFSLPEVREFCEKWSKHLSIGVSIDGCPEIHDMNRVYKDGTGTMSDIVKNWTWYRNVFPRNAQATKATCARNTIPYLYESLVWMHETLGLNYIHQNFIMEDTGCTDQDYELLDEQLHMCADYVLEHRHDLFWSMIAKESFVDSLTKDKKDSEYYTSGRCSSGCMPTLAIDGNIYPCFRWLAHTQNGEGKMCVGNVDEGFVNKENFVKVQQGSIRANCTKDPKCQDCEYEPACTYCIGGCYAEFGDFIRTTHICEIIKLQCKWAKYYWDRHAELEGYNAKGRN